MDSPVNAEVRLYRQSAISNPLDRVQLLRISPGLPSGLVSANSTNKLALIGAFGNGTAIHTMNSDGTGLKLILSESAPSVGGAVLRSPAWSPDGAKIAFNNFEADLLSHIHIITADGSGLTQITFAANVVDRNVSWSN